MDVLSQKKKLIPIPASLSSMHSSSSSSSAYLKSSDNNLSKLHHHHLQNFIKVLDMHGGLNSIPHDIITDILARVASSSATDLFNVKITCKYLNKAGDDKHVYRHISMGGFRLVPWKSSEEAFSSFLRRCEESENPEALFRRGMFKYFSSQQLEEGREMLHTAANLGHEASTYVLGIILMGNNDQSIRDHGMKLLSKISSSRSIIIRHCRKKSERIVRQYGEPMILFIPGNILCAIAIKDIKKDEDSHLVMTKMKKFSIVKLANGIMSCNASVKC